jgi:RNA polymerase sigma factor (TIGR02999 family)
MTDSHEHVTQLIHAAGQGDRDAADRLLPLVYDQLRAAAQLNLASERGGHTLQATALVHEAYVKLVGPRQIPWANRAHFYSAAAQAMRRILIDHARARKVRGGERQQAWDPNALFPDVASLANASPDPILAVDRALARLEGDDAEAAALIRLRFFAGLSVEQAALALGTSQRSAERLWAYARAMLHRLLAEQRGEEA